MFFSNLRNRRNTSNWNYDTKKISDCRSFSDFKTLTGCRSFSHSEYSNSSVCVPVSTVVFFSLSSFPSKLRFETCSPGSSSFCLFASRSSSSSRSLLTKAGFFTSSMAFPRSLVSFCRRFFMVCSISSFFESQEQCRNPVDIMFIPALGPALCLKQNAFLR